MDEALVVERQTSAPASTVYGHLTTSADWITWQGSDAELDPQPGGIFRMTVPDGRIARGQYVDLQLAVWHCGLKHFRLAVPFGRQVWDLF